MNLHAHMSSTATDCDGRIDRDWIEVINDDERANTDNGELTFQSRIVTNMVSLSGWGGKLEVVTARDGEDVTILDWYENTEEGKRHVEATMCTNECDLGNTLYRDHTAEKAGY